MKFKYYSTKMSSISNYGWSEQDDNVVAKMILPCHKSKHEGYKLNFSHL